MKKNVLLTFCFACIPGVGAMYMGYMKRGLSQLALFMGDMMLTSIFYLEPIIFLLPLLFAYCFFDTWNLRNQTPEQAAANPDAYIIHMNQLGGDNIKMLLEKRHVLIGWGCIAIAAMMLYNNIFMRFVWSFNDYIPGVIKFALNTIPTLAIIAALVLLGLYLLRGPRAFSHSAFVAPQEEYVAYTGAQVQQTPAQTVPVIAQAELVLAQTEPVAAPEKKPTPVLEMELSAVESVLDAADATETTDAMSKTKEEGDIYA